MWLKGLAIAAPLLQVWSKSTPSGRLVGLVFLGTMAGAGFRGIRTLV
jgi:hypothetical protein